MTPMQELQQIKKQLLNRRVSLFSSDRYVDYYNNQHGTYTLNPDRFLALQLDPTYSHSRAVSKISFFIKNYHSSNFLWKLWWRLTKPVECYQKLYEINLILNIEAVMQKNTNTARWYYENSLCKPDFIDRLFNSWRVSLSKMIHTLPPHIEIKNSSLLSSPPIIENTQSNSFFKSTVNSNPIAELSKELKKTSYSITKIVDIYEEIKLNIFSHNKKLLYDFEKQILIKIHPDRNKENEVEATQQTIRFLNIKKGTTKEELLDFATYIHKMHFEMNISNSILIQQLYDGIDESNKKFDQEIRKIWEQLESIQQSNSVRASI